MLVYLHLVEVTHLAGYSVCCPLTGENDVMGAVENYCQPYIDGKIFIFGGRVKIELGSSVFSGSGVGYKNDLYVFDPGTIF